MQDIRIDKDGNFRCSNCGGRNFQTQRTRRAKVIGVTAGVATVGLAGAATPLVAKQKLYCQACGTYNKMGNAKPFDATSALPKPSTRPKSQPSTPKKQPSKTEEQAGMLLMATISIFVFIWAASAGSIIWSIIAGLSAAFFIIALVADLKEAGKPSRKKTSQVKKGSTPYRNILSETQKAQGITDPSELPRLVVKGNGPRPPKKKSPTD